MSSMGAFETGAAGDILVLSVLPAQEDHAALNSIFRDSNWPLCPGSPWVLKSSRNLNEALPILWNGGISVVLCERDLQPGTWEDMVEALALLPDPPYLIVTSRHADDRLWVEALNLGAYDVLQTPFHAGEVTRTLSWAWSRWSERHQSEMSKAARSVA